LGQRTDELVSEIIVGFPNMTACRNPLLRR